MQKQKKRKEIEQAPDMLLWEIPFEFVSHLSLDECSSRLHAINDSLSILSPRRKVFLSSVEPHKILFNLSEPGSKLGEAWAVGFLEETSGNGTQVMGKVGISPEIIFLIIGLGIAGLILAPAILHSFGAFVFIAILIASLIVVIYLGITHIRTNLVNHLRTIFQQPLT
jgi:hypothetical protein